MEVCLNEKQTRERISQLKKLEGCILCKAEWNTRYLYMPPKGTKYYNDENGDFLLCPWHEKFYNAEWGDDAEAKAKVSGLVKMRKFDLPFFSEF